MSDMQHNLLRRRLTYDVGYSTGSQSHRSMAAAEHSNSMEFNRSTEDLNDRKMKIKMIIHFLEVSTLILAIVNLGKFLEGRAKNTIQQMTE